ncbi:MAG: phosphoribosyl-ATP diphosphatase [Clostridiales bacterium]|nr:phosphoribosyl-ATP diphosphatase [Clostridiales bacterium]
MNIIEELYSVVLNRQKNPTEGSYTNYLLNEGTEKIAKKVGEEAVETAIAAAKGSKPEVVGEISDVIYHMLVLMVNMGITPDDIEKELRGRRS